MFWTYKWNAIWYTPSNGRSIAPRPAACSPPHYITYIMLCMFVWKSGPLPPVHYVVCMYVVQEGALSTLQARDRTDEFFQAIFVIFSTFQPYGSFINNLKWDHNSNISLDSLLARFINFHSWKIHTGSSVSRFLMSPKEKQHIFIVILFGFPASNLIEI